LPEHRVVERVGAGQRRSVRARGAGTRLGAPDLDEYDRLSAFGRKLRHRDKLRNILEAFDEPGNDARLRVIDEIAGESEKARSISLPVEMMWLRPMPLSTARSRKGPKAVAPL